MVGILVVVFGLILPRFVDYEEVLAAFRALTFLQVVQMTALVSVAWVIAGVPFAVLIEGLSVARGTASYLILSGIGASIPLGPWNMGILWVVVRGWGIRVQPATSGIALYGVTEPAGAPGDAGPRGDRPRASPGLGPRVAGPSSSSPPSAPSSSSSPSRS